MKGLLVGFTFAASAKALVSRSQSCCFSLSVPDLGKVGQLSDGQNRVGGNLPPGNYCISNGTLIDGQGRGCILTSPTTQFQCDQGTSPSPGFFIDCNGILSVNGSSTFWQCPTGQNGENNIYTTPPAGQAGCTKIQPKVSDCIPQCSTSAPPLPPPSPPPTSEASPLPTSPVCPSQTQPPAPPPVTQTVSITVTAQAPPSTVISQALPVTRSMNITNECSPVTVTNQAPTVTVTNQAPPMTFTSQAPPVTLTTQGPPVPVTVTNEARPVTVTNQAPPVTVTGEGTSVTVTAQATPSTVTHQAPPVTVTSQGPTIPTTVISEAPPSPVTVTSQAPPLTVTVTSQAPPITVTNECSSVTVTNQVTQAPNTVTLTSEVPQVPNTVTLTSQVTQVPNTITLTSQVPQVPNTVTVTSQVTQAPNTVTVISQTPPFPIPSNTTELPQPTQPPAAPPVTTEAPPCTTEAPPATTQLPTPAPSPPSSACPPTISGSYQYPHLIVTVDSASPNTPSGTVFSGKITPTVDSLYLFDIPSSYAGQTCSLIFLLPKHADLVTSSYNMTGSGKVDFDQLSHNINSGTTWSSKGPSEHISEMTVSPGGSYTVSTFPCAAGQAVSYQVSSSGGTSLQYFQDYNPAPIGLYVRVC